MERLSIEAELNKLKFQNKIISICCLFLVCFGLFVSLSGASQNQAIIRAREFHVYDANGKNRIVLAVNPQNNKTVINVWDADGIIIKTLGEDR